MNLIDLITRRDYISLVKEFIEKVFVHEARLYRCEKQELSIILHRDNTGDIQILTYSNTENKTLRVIPDKEAQEILMK
jgi:hypothetical protein